MSGLNRFKAIEYKVKMIEVSLGKSNVFGADFEGFFPRDDVLCNLHDLERIPIFYTKSRVLLVGHGFFRQFNEVHFVNFSLA